MHRFITIICIVASLGMIWLGLRVSRIVESDEAKAAPVVEKPIRYAYDARWKRHLPEMPSNDCVRLYYERLGVPVDSQFNDSSYRHLASAERLGVGWLGCVHDAEVLERRGKLVKEASCQEFYLDSLTHSYPYLVPQADRLLRDIGREFNGRLLARGGGHYRIKVTSMLRTRESIERLRRVNSNAVDTSAHLYGTTFDISHSQYICDRQGPNRTADDLKGLLSEVLAQYQRQGRCYVMHEKRQACFHITARK